MSGGFLDATQSGTIGSGLGSSSTGAQGSAPVSSNVCPSCGSTEIDVDRCRGNAVCTGCGQVLEHNMIVNDVEFIESGSGDAKRAVGQFVGVNQRGMKSSFAGFHPGIQQDCMENSIEKGRKLIYQFASSLSIHGHCADLAHGFYKMLLERRFMRGGRRNALVAAGCLYLACRNEQIPLLLLDFSDQLEETVVDLSQMYIRIARELCINPPSADPCIYIERFCEKLDFGQETKDVSMTSMRILSRMKRDWIAAGRRPFGLCGASIYMGAKLHGFDRSLAEIVKVVGAQAGTMTKRLKEFAKTASSKLTIEEFYLVDLEEEHDPPSFHEMRAKRGINFPEFNEEEFQRLDTEIERNIELCKSQKHSLTKLDSVLGRHSGRLYRKEDGTSEGLSNGEKSGKEVDLSDLMGLPKDTLSAVDGGIEGVTDLIKNAMHPEAGEEEQEDEGTGYLPVTCASLGIDPLNAQNGEDVLDRHYVSSNRNGEEGGDKTKAEELFIDDLDDMELDSYILSQEESERKAILWAAAYGPFMEQRAAKKKLKEELKEQNAAGNKKRAPKPRSQEGYARPSKKLKTDRPAATANEAIDNIIKQKNISEKINVSVLQNLRIEKLNSNASETSLTNGSSGAFGEPRQESSTSSLSQMTSGKIASRLASAFRKNGARPGSNVNKCSKLNSPGMSSASNALASSVVLKKSPSKEPPVLKEFDMFAKK